MTSEQVGRVCPVHGEYAPTGICRWCEKQPLPGLKGIWQTPDRVEMNEAGVPTYTFSFAGENAIAVRWTLDFTPAICPEDLIAAFEAEFAAQHAALRWERVARRWNYKHRQPGGLDEAARRCVWLRWSFSTGA